MTHDPEQLLAELIQLEQRLDTMGWDDTPPFMWMLGLNQGRWELQRLGPCPSPAGPSVVVRHLARGLDRHPAGKRAMRALHPPGYQVICVAVSTESWSLRLDAPREEYDRIAIRREIMIADSLWGQESRMVSAVDIDGRGYLVERIRGQQPTGRCTPDAEYGGAIPDALRELLPVIISTTEAAGDARR